MSVLWLIISVCECCGLLRQDCLPLPFVHRRPLFLMGECAKLLSAHMAPGGRVGVPCSLCKHANVLQSGGSTAAMEAPPLHTANARQPNNRVWLRGRQANTLANGTFIYLSSRPPPPPPNILHLLGSAVPFPGAPWQQRAMSTRGTTFSWCHRAMWLAVCCRETELGRRSKWYWYLDFGTETWPLLRPVHQVMYPII